MWILKCLVTYREGGCESVEEVYYTRHALLERIAVLTAKDRRLIFDVRWVEK